MDKHDLEKYRSKCRVRSKYITCCGLDPICCQEMQVSTHHNSLPSSCSDNDTTARKPQIAWHGKARYRPVKIRKYIDFDMYL